MTNHLQLARDHIIVGEALLNEARRQMSASSGLGDPSDPRQAFSQDHPDINALVATAGVHFTASMAHTNLLLADPAEAPEPVER